MFAINSRTCLRFAAPARVVRARAQGKGDDPIAKAADIPDNIKESLEPRVEELKENVFQSGGKQDPKEIMRADGPAPELINGRLAMVGFFAAVCAELFSHNTVFAQFKQAAGPIFITAMVIIVASIVPIARGTDVTDDGAGGEGKGGVRPGFNITNELINGRAAMLGLALLLAYEAVVRGPLF